MNILHASFPDLRLPYRALASLPSALDPAPGLAGALGLRALLSKRDDQASPVYGGNKVRKLEYLLGDALASRCDAVLTFGAAGSNHVLATAVHAHALGLRCYAVLTDQVQTAYVANTLRWHVLLGTVLRPADGWHDADVQAERLRGAHPTGAARVATVPWGGSSPLGTVGFVNAALELVAQLPAQRDREPPLRIYLPCGTMGSVAGLLVGLAVAKVDAAVVAVKVVPHNRITPDLVLRLAHDTAHLLHARDPAFPAAPPLPTLEYRDEFVGAGYAEPTDAGREAIALAHDLEGWKIDTTYSGKALACLVADARAGRLAESVPVFWQTWNSRPYPPGIADVGPRKVPEALRKFLA